MSSINGQEYQHALIKLFLNPGLTNVPGVSGAPIRLRTFSDLSWEPNADKRPVYDSQGQPIGWTIDPLKYDGAITLLRSEWLAAKALLLQQNPGLGILQVRVPSWAVIYGNAFVTTQKETLTNVMFQNDPFKSDKSQDPLYVDLKLFILGSTDESGIAPVVYSQ